MLISLLRQSPYMKEKKMSEKREKIALPDSTEFFQKVTGWPESIRCIKGPVKPGRRIALVYGFDELALDDKSPRTPINVYRPTQITTNSTALNSLAEASRLAFTPAQIVTFVNNNLSFFIEKQCNLTFMVRGFETDHVYVSHPIDYMVYIGISPHFFDHFGRDSLENSFYVVPRFV